MAKVLIVSSEGDECNLIRLALSSQSHIVLETNNSKEGLLIFKLFEPNIIIVDFNLTTGSSLDFVRDLRSLANNEQLKIIATLSMNSWLEESAEMMEAGADLFLPKPLEITNDMAVFQEAIASLYNSNRV